MQLSQLRNYSSSREYQLYQEYLSLQKSISDLEASRTPDHDELLRRYPELSQLVQVGNSYLALMTSAQQKLSEVTNTYRDNFQKLSDSNVLSAFYKEALEDVTHQYLDELSKTLTEVYYNVYGRTDKQVQLVLEDYRGKKVVRLKYLKTYEGNLYAESLDEDGGSAQIILGLIIAIYFLLATNSPRVIFIDESLSAIDTAVLHRFLAVLKKFSTELGFCFMVIDHAPFRFRGYIDQLYTVEDGVYREVAPTETESFIEATKGDDYE